MPGGKHDSSKTRVGPVFDKLRLQEDGWISRLLALPVAGCGQAPDVSIDLRLVRGYGFSKHVTENWSAKEKALNPSVALLSWLVRHGQSLRAQTNENHETRTLLREGDPKTVGDALKLLRTEGKDRAWYVFEGPTYPDVYLETRDALVVVEGKRTEWAPTSYTKWLDGRHQIWRHIDAAWEIRGRRKIYGFFIVESGSSDNHETPNSWKEASQACFAEGALRSSFPHRSAQETSEISRCFLGVTTWQQVCATFGIDFSSLPDEVSDSDQLPETTEPLD
jgi:hypothetical protein